MEPLLELQNIGKSFEGLMVLEDVSLVLKTGTVTALFGENGCGKTTLFHIITGFQQPGRGRVAYKGLELNNMNPVYISRMGIGRVWQSPRICKNLNTLDNLLLASKDHPGDKVLNYLFQPAAVWRAEKQARDQAISVLNEVGLAGKVYEQAGALSFGQQKLLSIGMLLMNGADVLLMDEPFAGVNPMMIDHISETLGGLRNSGRAICIIEHNRAKARSIADQVCFLSKGKITTEN